MTSFASGRPVLLALVLSMLTVSLAGCGGGPPSQWSESKKERYKQDLSEALEESDPDAVKDKMWSKYDIGPDADLSDEDKQIILQLTGEVMREKMGQVVKDAFPGVAK